jgi:AraC-like DNA-binding protein
MQSIQLRGETDQDVCDQINAMLGLNIQVTQLGLGACETVWNCSNLDDKMMISSAVGGGATATRVLSFSDEHISFTFDPQTLFIDGVCMQDDELAILIGEKFVVKSTMVNQRSLTLLYSDIKQYFSDEALETMGSCSSARLSSKEKHKFLEFHEECRQGQHEAKTACQFMSSLLDGSLERFNNEKVEGWDMGVEMVELAHSQTPENLIKLPDLSKMLLTNRNKISEVSKRFFELTPMQLIRLVRLQQCRSLLKDTNAMKKHEFTSIEDVRTRYGFSNRKAFNEQYTELFNISPVDDIAA